MKKETALNIVSLIVVIGAFFLELFNSIKETGELSLRAILMDTAAPVTSVVYAGSDGVEGISAELRMWE